MGRRDEAVNFLATETLPFMTEKSEAFKPINTVPTVNHCGGSLMFLELFVGQCIQKL